MMGMSRNNAIAEMSRFLARENFSQSAARAIIAKGREARGTLSQQNLESSPFLVLRVESSNFGDGVFGPAFPL